MFHHLNFCSFPLKIHHENQARIPPSPFFTGLNMLKKNRFEKKLLFEMSFASKNTDQQFENYLSHKKVTKLCMKQWSHALEKYLYRSTLLRHYTFDFIYQVKLFCFLQQIVSSYFFLLGVSICLKRSSKSWSINDFFDLVFSDGDETLLL